MSSAALYACLDTPAVAELAACPPPAGWGGRRGAHGQRSDEHDHSSKSRTSTKRERAVNIAGVRIVIGSRPTAVPGIYCLVYDIGAIPV